MKNERIFLSRPHMGGTEINYIDDAFEKNWIAPLGENVTGFENDVKSYVDMSHAVALSSGTAAIHLALIECGVKKNDIVFCSTLTFCASANPILYQYGTPVFIDSELNSWNMSPIALKKAFENYSKRGVIPKAVIVVNLYGQSANYNEIVNLCREYNVTLIEDAAESLGSEYEGRMSGSLGDYSIFSFNGNKIITTSGGGMLLSNNKEDIEHSLFLATQARDQEIHYQHSELGFNYRLSNVSAGIGRGQMEVLPRRIERRREIFNNYQNKLSGIPGIKFQQELPNSKSNRWLTALQIDDNQSGFTVQKVIEHLAKKNIEARPVWKPMHLQPLYAKYDYIVEDNDNAKALFENGVCLPSSSDMSNEQQEKVIKEIKLLTQ